MLLDNLIAEFMIKKNISVKNIKLSLRVFYILINIFLYYSVFYKMNNSWIGLAIFLLIAILFDYIRSGYLTKYINERKASH
jgi:uncharacterized protein YqgC (DUF456 family)